MAERAGRGRALAADPPGGAGLTTEAGPQRRTELATSLVLGAIAFTIVTAETLPVGLIGDVASGLHASPSQVGLAVSWYALIAAGAGVPLTRLTASLDRRRVLVGCAAVLGIGQLLAAAAPDLLVLLLGRSLAALGHGLFFSVASPVLIRLARPEAQGRAGSRPTVGGAIALVAGTPLATALGQVAGWRVAMLVVAAVALGLTLATARLLPTLPALHRDQPREAGGVLSTLRSPGLNVVFAASLVVVSAHFVLYTYIAPTAGRLGVSGTAFTVLLLGFGVAAVLGSTLAGRLVDLGPVAGIRVAAVLFTAALAGLWGGTFALLVGSTGLAVLRRAPGPRVETAGALYNIVFQLGIVAGSALGSACFAAGFLPALPLLAAAGGLAALVLVGSRGSAFRRGPVG